MNVAICDDEVACINRLIQLLQPYKEKEVLNVDTFLSGEEFLDNSFGIEQYDIIFLDIEMFNVSGLDVAETLRNRGSKAIIIFITSYVVENGDIYYIEGYNRHLFIHTNATGYECVGKLPEEEKKLKPYNFVRCHQGYIVNMSKIKEINKTSIILNNDIVIPIGRKYREELLEAFNLYLAGRTV